MPLQWCNQLWQSLEEWRWKARLGVWKCPFNGDTIYGIICRTGQQSKVYSVEVPLQWRNQLWQSLEEGCRTARLRAWECPFSGVTIYGSLEEGCQKARFGAWECPFYKALRHQNDLPRYTSPPPLSLPTATTKHAVSVCMHICMLQTVKT